jgi:hypothetical protein
MLAVLAAELGLRAAGVAPRVAHITRGSAEILQPATEGKPPLYRPHAHFHEQWPSDPHHYFRDPRHRLTYRTNNVGFRGRDFSLTRDERVRIAVVGDSFCFGHGVRDEDVWTEKMERLLAQASIFGGRFEVYNFGMGGYNTEMEIALFERVALEYQPDVAVIWYFLNDVSTENDLGTRSFLGGDDFLRSLRPYCRFLDLALAPLDARLNEPRLIRLYLDSYQDGQPGIQTVAGALSRFGRLCRENEIVPVLAVHPILFRLNEGYPFRSVHDKVLALAREAGITAVDLFPYFQGRDARSLWVHPSDQHPNHLAHQIAAENFSRDLLRIMAANQDVISRSGERKRSRP